ncbi:hypothetical protein EV401DRAFT_1891494 [Pisolithus croceorrhizus]|nr:hypothetical protein EV401DRAFT_1891494 [Pisolithus croceorrhizus]
MNSDEPDAREQREFEQGVQVATSTRILCRRHEYAMAIAAYNSASPWNSSWHDGLEERTRSEAPYDGDDGVCDSKEYKKQMLLDNSSTLTLYSQTESGRDVNRRSHVCPGNRWTWVVFWDVLGYAFWISLYMKFQEQAEASHRNNHGKNGSRMCRFKNDNLVFPLGSQTRSWGVLLLFVFGSQSGADSDYMVNNMVYVLTGLGNYGLRDLYYKCVGGLRSRKCRLFASRNPSGSASNSVPEQSKGPSQAPTRDVAAIAGTSGNVSQGVFARARYFFHRSNRDSVAGAVRGEQEQGEEAQAVPIQDVCDLPYPVIGMTLSKRVGQTQGPADNPETGGVLAVPDSNVDTTVGPIGDAGKNVADPNSGANTTPIPVPAPIGSELDTAQEALGRMMTIPHVGQTAIDLVTQADSAVANIQTFNSTYLQPLKVFSSIVNTVAQVHPYAQIALGILTAAAQSLINQANLDRDVSDLFGTVRAVYEFPLEDDTIRNINSMTATLGKIARATSDAARFIKDYSEATSFCMEETWKEYHGYTV